MKNIQYARLTKQLLMLSILFLLICFFSISISRRTMQQHPDSMISGGLRWLSQGPFDFQYNTYGPVAYSVYGLFSVIYFILGRSLGLWTSISEFEISYRLNTLRIEDLKFSSFYLALNLCMLLLSFYLLAKSRKKMNKRSMVVALLLLGIPIIAYQFTLETIESLVFFGISLTIYTFSNVSTLVLHSRRLVTLTTLSWLLTFGIRLSTLPIIALYALASILELRNHRYRFRFYLTLCVSVSISLFSYIPVFLDAKNLNYVITLNKSLSKISLDTHVVYENIESLLINLGFWFIPTVIGLILSILKWRTRDIFEKVAVVTICFYSILYLINTNGFPKYIMPIIPLIIIMLIQASNTNWRVPNNSFLSWNSNFNFVILVFIGTWQMGYTLDSFVEKSRFDTRLEVKKFITKFDDWEQNMATTESVLADITRGPQARDYTHLQTKIQSLNVNEACPNLLVLSSTSHSVSQAKMKIAECIKDAKVYSLVVISPFSFNYVPQRSKEGKALLSLGTSEDQERFGYGPVYWIGLFGEYSEVLFGEQLCRNIYGCNPLKI